MKPKNKIHSRAWWKRNFPTALDEIDKGFFVIDEIIVYYSFN